jgi:hypothetical protein
MLRIAFIDGEVLIEISPEAIETHNKAKRKITEVPERIVDDDDLGEACADGLLLTNELARLSTVARPYLRVVGFARVGSSSSGREDESDDDVIEIGRHARSGRRGRQR